MKISALKMMILLLKIDDFGATRKFEIEVLRVGRYFDAKNV